MSPRFARVGAAIALLAGLAPHAVAEQAAPAAEQAPASRLTGEIRERGTRAALAGATLGLFRPGQDTPELETQSDADGAFAFPTIPAGSWKVRVEAPGYQPFVAEETIEPAQALSVTYYLERTSENPFDVTVTSTRPRKEVSRTSITTNELEKVPGVAGDPLAVVQSLPGVARSSFAAGEIIVRGSAPEDTHVLVNGVELPLIYHFGGLRSMIPMQMLRGIDFYPGNFGAAYGRATGGVVDVQLATLEPERFGGSVDVNLLDASVYLEAPLGPDAAVAIAGRRSYIGEVLGAVLPDDALSFRVAPRYYDYQLLARYSPSREHELGLFLLGSDDRLELFLESPADLDPALTSDDLSSSERFYRAVVSHRFTPNRRLSNRLDLAYGYSKEDDALAQIRIAVDTHRLELRNELRHDLGDALTLVYGVDAQLTWLDLFVRAPLLTKEGEPDELDLSELTTTRARKTRLEPAAYVNAELEPLPGLKLFPGLRVDYFDRTDQTSVQPRLSTRWTVGAGLTLKGAVGLYAQAPSDDELNPDFGNPGLELERAVHYAVGAEYQPLRHLSLDATLFYKQLSNLVSPSDALVQDGETPRPLRYDNEGEGRAYGAELVLRHELASGFSGWLAYTLSRSVRTDSGETVERLFDYDQTHILTLVASYQLPHDWQIGARFRYVSGNPLTPVVGSTFNADDDRYDPIYGAINSERDPAFHQLDVRIDKRWVFDTWMFNAYLELQNAYNRKNAEGLSYRYDYRQSQRQSGLPLLPVIGLRADF